MTVSIVLEVEARTSPKPEEPSHITSTCTTSASSCDSREITNVSASGSLTIRAVNSTRARLDTSPRP